MDGGKMESDKKTCIRHMFWSRDIADVNTFVT
jgi:hypothetical protein